MTRQKTFKRKVRARMQKTGESYTAARRRLIAAGERPEVEAPDFEPPMSDDAMRERTGRGWDEWFALLDAWEAASRPHPDVARWLRDEHGVERAAGDDGDAVAVADHPVTGVDVDTADRRVAADLTRQRLRRARQRDERAEHREPQPLERFDVAHTAVDHEAGHGDHGGREDGQVQGHGAALGVGGDPAMNASCQCSNAHPRSR